MFSILVANNAMERANIRERSIAGTRRVVKERGWAGRRPPYGDRIGPDGRLAINETPIPGCTVSEAEVVRLIFRRVAEERLSLLSIAARLNAMGIPTSSMTEGRKRNLHKGYLAGVWQLAALSYLIHGTTYKGFYLYGRTSKNPDSELISQPVPAIVSPELWDQAQDALRRNLRWAKRNARREYLPSGLMRCAFCGRRFQATTPTNCTPRYRCSGSITQDTLFLGKVCKSRHLPLAWIEDLVWEELKGWILNHHDLEAVMTEALQEQEQKRQEWADSLARVKRDLGQAETQRGRVLTLYRKGLMSDAELEQQLSELKTEHGHLQRVAEELEKRLSFTVDLDSAVVSIRHQLEAFRKALHKKTVPFPLKRKIVETFVNEVVVSLERGNPLHVAKKEVVPFRAEQTESRPEKSRSLSWQREGTAKRTKERHTGTVQIFYRFPFPPQPKTLTSITFTTPMPAL